MKIQLEKIELSENTIIKIKGGKNSYCIISFDKANNIVEIKKIKTNTARKSYYVKSGHKRGRPEKPVYLYDSDGNLIKRYDSISECANNLNMRYGTLKNAELRKGLLNKMYYVSTINPNEYTIPIKKYRQTKGIIND